MMKTIRILRSYIVLSLLLPVLPVFSADFRLGMDMGISYNSRHNYLDRGTLSLPDQMHFSRDRSYPMMNATPYLSFGLTKGVNGYIQADMIWQDSDDETYDEQSEVDLTNAYLSLSEGEASVDLGLQTVLFGNGLIMADDVPAAVFILDFGKTKLRFTLAQALNSSPMAAASIGYQPGDFENLALFGIWFEDADNAFAKSLPPIYQLLYEPESEGNLYWIGASLELFVGKSMFSAVGAYQWGRFRLFDKGAGIRRDIDVSAFLSDLSVEGNLSDWCSLGLFIFASSGDEKPLSGNLNSFAAIMPFNTRAAIFFDPDFLSRDLESQMLTYSGGYFGGVVAPGLILTLASDSGLSLETTVATFYAWDALADGSQWYGWEIDLELSYTFARYYTVYAEGARFQHGDYYQSLLEEKPDPATRIALGLRASF